MTKDTLQRTIIDQTNGSCEELSDNSSKSLHHAKDNVLNTSYDEILCSDKLDDIPPNCCEKLDNNEILNEIDETEDDTTHETTKRVDRICQTEECVDIEGITLHDMCNFESPDRYQRMKQFVTRYEANDLTTDMLNVLQHLPDQVHIAKATDKSVQIMDRFENLLMLRIFKRLKLIEKTSIDYKVEIDRYNKQTKPYVSNSSTVKKIHEFNIRPTESKMDEQCLELINQGLTNNKLTNELLMCELLHYRPESKTIFNEDELEFIAHQIKSEIDRFNPIIRIFLEDQSWTVNFKSTLNFAVPECKIILSNSINTDDQENDHLIDHMDMMVKFIKRCFKIPSLKYKIVEDNKYHFSWILISIGYYPKKIIETVQRSKSSSNTGDKYDVKVTKESDPILVVSTVQTNQDIDQKRTTDPISESITHMRTPVIAASKPSQNTKSQINTTSQIPIPFRARFRRRR